MHEVRSCFMSSCLVNDEACDAIQGYVCMSCLVDVYARVVSFSVVIAMLLILCTSYEVLCLVNVDTLDAKAQDDNVVIEGLVV